MKKTMMILITLLIVILFTSFNKSSKEEIVMKDDNKIDLMINEIKEEKPKYEKEVVVKTTQEVVQQQKELPLPDLDIEDEAIIESEDDVFLPPLSDLKNQLNPATVVLKKSEDYLPPIPEVKEENEESYFYEGRIVSKQEYLRLNINEDVNPKDLVTDENEFSFDNVDAALKDLAPEPIKVKKVVKKKASNTPDLNDLFN